MATKHISAAPGDFATFLREHASDASPRVRVGAAAYPHDADSIDALFAACEEQLSRDPD